MADFLISIRPVFIAKILRGQKTFELRRGCTRVEKGDRAFLYGTSPMKSIAGECIVRRVVVGRPEEIRRGVEGRAGLSVGSFFEYYAGARFGSALELTGVVEYREPLTLESLRELRNGFVVPQSYRFLDEGLGRILAAYGRGRRMPTRV